MAATGMKTTEICITPEDSASRDWAHTWAFLSGSKIPSTNFHSGWSGLTRCS